MGIRAAVEHSMQFHHAKAGCGRAGPRDAVGPPSCCGRRCQTMGGCRNLQATGEDSENHEFTQQQAPRWAKEGGDGNVKTAGSERASTYLQARSGGLGRCPSPSSSPTYPNQSDLDLVLPERLVNQGLG